MTILGQEAVTRRRYVAGTRTAASEGAWVEGTSTDTEILASVQPANARDLQIIEEGLRQRDAIKVYTDDEALRTGNQHDGVSADEVIVDGISYQVQSVARQRAVLPHYKAICVRVQEAA